MPKSNRAGTAKAKSKQRVNMKAYRWLRPKIRGASKDQEMVGSGTRFTRLQTLHAFVELREQTQGIESGEHFSKTRIHNFLHRLQACFDGVKPSVDSFKASVYRPQLRR